MATQLPPLFLTPTVSIAPNSSAADGVDTFGAVGATGSARTRSQVKHLHTIRELRLEVLTSSILRTHCVSRNVSVLSDLVAVFRPLLGPRISYTLTGGDVSSCLQHNPHEHLRCVTR